MHDRTAFIRYDLEPNPITNCRKSLAGGRLVPQATRQCRQKLARSRVDPITDIVLEAYAARLKAAFYMRSKLFLEKLRPTKLSQWMLVHMAYV